MAADPAYGGHALLRAWQRRGPLACALWPASLLYRALLAARRLAYRLGQLRSTRLPVPVLVVGNVVVGGAGKTPTVVGLVAHLRAQGWTPGVVSRGHGRQADGCLEVQADTDSALAGDEPALIARATGAPLVVGRDRVAAARRLLAQHPDVDLLVSDDGMQHWALQRDMTVVVFDGRGTGNGWLLPAGLLREPWPARAWGGGPLLVLQTQAQADIRPLAPHPYPAFSAPRTLAPTARDAWGQAHPWAPAHHAETAPAPPRAWRALAGIAQPEQFFGMLRAAGLVLERTVALPDHASADTLLAALDGTPANTVWLCTEKDAVKLFPHLRQRPGPRVWAVPLQQTLPADFLAAIDAALAGLSSRHGHQTP
ncbi:tetraacyldisaccharide 4'-kinase [Aquabacterium sp. A08]|uniref:tetraacyldisaccharide 4'-kinase n=1 Tax=Aquabacterium sp. A08 TaxID=2718532 RepID=UPI001421E12B|nr:tetraacyldisaccharide 4'-kinase [Aquabacterium sp. A08]NIC40514.1 tetraacyldisaccharide 4'-kinase [Aquabacterium sp. A08]